jgi:two-component system KDP operon response regulator KdpE
MTTPERTTLLIVDDEPSLREFVGVTLGDSGYDVLFAADGEGVFDLVNRQQPHLVIMDIIMPGLSGLEVLRRLRSDGSQVPVIMLTGRGFDDDKLAAFEAGADDYLTKPFSSRELVARVAAVLRRARLASTDSEEADSSLHVGALTLIPGKHSATIQDREVSLTRTEYSLLLTLARHAGRVFTPAELLTRVWGPEYRDQAEILRTNMYRLRQKLEEDPRQPRFVCTRPGVGYYFCAD